MKRRHTLAISLLLGAALAAGAVATATTLERGRSPQARVSDAEIAAETARLDRLEVSLRESIATRPPEPLAAAAPAGSGHASWRGGDDYDDPADYVEHDGHHDYDLDDRDDRDEDGDYDLHDDYDGHDDRRDYDRDDRGGHDDHDGYDDFDDDPDDDD